MTSLVYYYFRLPFISDFAADIPLAAKLHEMPSYHAAQKSEDTDILVSWRGHIVDRSLPLTASRSRIGYLLGC